MLAFGAWMALESGRPDASRALIDELVAVPDGAAAAADYFTEVGWLAADLDPRLAAGIDSAGVAQRINGAIFEGRLDAAIEIADSTGDRTTANYARLRLARRRVESGEDPEPWLSAAEAFYRGVRATRFVRQLEELRAIRRSA